MTQEALKLALDALEANDKFINGTGTNGGLVYCMDGYYSDCFDVDPINKQTKEAITAIKEALAQPEQLHASEDVSIGVDVTEDGAHVTALQSYRNGAKVVFYSQFHSAPQRTEQEPVADDFFRMIADRNPKPFSSPQRTWVGLAAEDRLTAKYMQDAPDGIEAVIDYLEAKLKEKNCAG